MTAQLAAPAIGYRAFKWDGSGPLKSVGVEASWPITREPQRAKCIATTEPLHDAPQEDCTCGIYAYSHPGAVAGSVGAVVVGYGDVIVHPDGWRAAMVELCALLSGCEHAFCDHWPRCEMCSKHDALSLLAAAYGVPLVDRWEDGVALAQEQGAVPIPEIMHAEAEAYAPLVGIAFQPLVEAMTAASVSMAACAESFSALSLTLENFKPLERPSKRHGLADRLVTPQRRHARFAAELAKRAQPRATSS